MHFNNLKTQKKQLRKRLKRARATIDEAQRKAYSANITESCLSIEPIRSAKTIFIYISYATEVDTHELLETLLTAGKTLAVPKLISKDKMISVKFNDWNELKSAELGILAPQSTTPLDVEYDVCITPGLGFTESGKRIGFGAGYYDRWFAEHAVKHKIALAFEEQIIPDIPTDEYDKRVDCIITEQRVIDTNNTQKD